MSDRSHPLCLTLGLALVTFSFLPPPHLLHSAPPPPRRAPTPDWTKDDAQELFYDDAFLEALDGERPASLGSTASGQNTKDASTVGVPPTTVTGTWSNCISAESLEDEVKRIKQQLDTVVTTPVKFQAGEHRAARSQFTQLAIIFAIISEYDGTVRWKDDAAVARDIFAAAARGAKVGTAPAYQGAKRAQEDLANLVRGGRLNGSARPLEDWSTVAPRNELMKRLEQAFEAGIAVWTANPSRFSDEKVSLVRESELTAALTRVLTSAEMEDATDDDYAAYARRIEQAASAIVQAVRDDNQAEARRQAGEIRKACSQCHEDYRG